MRIEKVYIKNFRSIESATVDFNPFCRILVGINESGKSNVLKALSLLSDDHLPNKLQDIRDPLPNEDPISESYVRFFFNFELFESDDFIERVMDKVLSDKENSKVVLNETKQFSIKDVCQSQRGGIYTINIINETKTIGFLSFDKSYRCVSGWKKPTPQCPADYVVEVGNEDKKLVDYRLINLKDYSSIPEEYINDIELKDLVALVGEKIIETTKDYVLDSIFWNYDENNLLPNLINIEEFSTNPKSCKPLENMFTLAGISDIKNSLLEVRKRTPNQIQNYLDGIAKKTTTHFRNVWKEYRNIEFSLKLNADQIIPGIKEINTHDFSRRSDGFKRFVTFLLMISVSVKTENISNTLLLIDEPDMSLHPSGARFLRDELIRISKTNFVVYSTHSIFMIDTGNINRHFIVKKKNEITTVDMAGESNISDEEVLYNALGYSVFDLLKERNIIFEGWNDKALFLSAINHNNKLEKKFKNIGACHARGVPQIKNITPIMELAKRKCLIISDSDAPAVAQKESYLKIKGYGDWKTYQDIDSAVLASTGEDFIKNDFIAKKVSDVLGSSISFDKVLLPLEDKKIEAIQKFLRDSGLSQDQIRDTVTRIKDSIFQDLKGSNIEDKYIKLLESLVI